MGQAQPKGLRRGALQARQACARREHVHDAADALRRPHGGLQARAGGGGEDMAAWRPRGQQARTVAAPPLTACGALRAACMPGCHS